MLCRARVFAVDELGISCALLRNRALIGILPTDYGIKTIVRKFHVKSVYCLATMVLCSSLVASDSVAPKVTRKAAGKLELAGLTWYPSLEAASKEAVKTGKPILHLQMFGKLDDTFC